MKKILIVPLLWGLFVVNVQAQAVQLNSEKIAKDIRLLCLDSIFTEQQRTVRLEFSIEDGEKKSFLRQLLLDLLVNEKGWMLSDSASGTVKVEQFDSHIVYAQQPLGLLGWKHQVERRHLLLFKGFVESENGRVERVWKFNTQFSDTLAEGSVENLKQDPYVFARGRYIEYSNWKKIIEPVLVGVSIAGLVYLFFSVRS